MAPARRQPSQNRRRAIDEHEYARGGIGRYRTRFLDFNGGPAGKIEGSYIPLVAGAFGNDLSVATHLIERLEAG